MVDPAKSLKVSHWLNENISHLGKKRNIFKNTLGGDMMGGMFSEG